jgi:hypothetical protein
MELVDIADLKSAALFERAGSSPALGTKSSSKIGVWLIANCNYAIAS